MEKTTNEIYLCNGYKVKAIIKNSGHEPYNETTVLFNIDDLCAAMGWSYQFREFLLSQDARNKEGYMKEDEIGECIRIYSKFISDNYDKWRISDVYNSPNDCISNDEMKEIQKENLKELALKAVIGIAIVVGIALIL